jgi:hypothetical protein
LGSGDSSSSARDDVRGCWEVVAFGEVDVTTVVDADESVELVIDAIRDCEDVVVAAVLGVAVVLIKILGVALEIALAELTAELITTELGASEGSTSGEATNALVIAIAVSCLACRSGRVIARAVGKRPPFITRAVVISTPIRCMIDIVVRPRARSVVVKAGALIE